MPQHGTVHDPGLRCGRARVSRIVRVTVVLVVGVTTFLAANASELRSAGAGGRIHGFATLDAHRTVYETTRVENASRVLVQLEDDEDKVLTQSQHGSDPGGAELVAPNRLDGSGRLRADDDHARGPPATSSLL